MNADRPLFGRRIVVTRSRAQAHRLSVLLQAAGAEVIEVPAIRIVPPDDYGPVDRAIERLAEYRWAVFTSQNAVTAFIDRLWQRGGTPSLLSTLRIASIGPATARALLEHGLRPVVAPTRFVAEALVEAFAQERPEDVRDARVLLPRASAARAVLPDGLRALGASVDVVAVYRVEMEREQDVGAWARLSRGPIDAVTFTSPSTVRHFVELTGPEGPRVLGDAIIACIGPVTAAAVRELGLSADVIAETYTIPGLVEALRGRLGRAFSSADR